MPDQFMMLCPVEFEIMRDAKINMLRLQNPYLAPTEEPEPKEQTHEEQMQMVTMANSLMDGDS